MEPSTQHDLDKHDLGKRGLGGSRQAKPASEIDIHYGHGLLAQASAGWGRYLAVTSPTAFQVARNVLSTAPVGSAYIHSLDATYLREAVAKLPDDAKLVVALGGGQALDAAKYVAAAKNLPLILVPTIVSTGAIIHGYCATFTGRTIVGDRGTWAWADCEYVLVDYDLVLAAPDHLNTAGLGDVLCEHSGVAEWRYHQKHFARANSPAFAGDAPDLTALEAFHKTIIEQFPATCDAQGRLTAESIRFIMTTLQQRDTLRVRHPLAPNADHAVLFTLETANDKSWIHGEVVALGALIICWRCDENPAAFAEQLDRCRVRWRPAQLAISKEELRRGLATLPAYFEAHPDSLESGSILRARPVSGAAFEELWNYLQAH